MRTPWQIIVQSTVEEILRTSQVPGMVIAFTKEDGPVEHLVLGTDGQARPLRVETLFPVASITKLATALAILHLAASGDLSLDDQLEKHLLDAAAARQGVTLRMLLSHTNSSGQIHRFDPCPDPYGCHCRHSRHWRLPDYAWVLMMPAGTNGRREGPPATEGI
jgi:CubicO group peptidase (beta-lactamase class C family)